jgi:hypothetical protein
MDFAMTVARKVTVADSQPTQSSGQGVRETRCEGPKLAPSSHQPNFRLDMRQASQTGTKR